MLNSATPELHSEAKTAVTKPTPDDSSEFSPSRRSGRIDAEALLQPFADCSW